MLLHKMYAEDIEKLPQDDSAHRSLRDWIADHIRKEEPQVCVEIGTHRGVTALRIANELRNVGSGLLYTFDPHEYGFLENLKKFPELNDFVRYRQIKSVESDVYDIDFLFVDGRHEYKIVREEIKHFLPRLTRGAFVLFHDCGGDNELVGVNQAIDEAGLETTLLDFAGSKSRLYVHKD